jgi:hypothetical protein
MRKLIDPSLNFVRMIVAVNVGGRRLGLFWCTKLGNVRAYTTLGNNSILSQDTKFLRFLLARLRSFGSDRAVWQKVDVDDLILLSRTLQIFPFEKLGLSVVALTPKVGDGCFYVPRWDGKYIDAEGAKPSSPEVVLLSSVSLNNTLFLMAQDVPLVPTV